MYKKRKRVLLNHTQVLKKQRNWICMNIKKGLYHTMFRSQDNQLLERVAVKVKWASRRMYDLHECLCMGFISVIYAGMNETSAIIVFLLTQKHNHSYTPCPDVIQDAIL